MNEEYYKQLKELASRYKVNFKINGKTYWHTCGGCGRSDCDECNGS